MPGPNPILKARFDAEVHKRFVARAAALKLSESELLRRAVNRELDGQVEESQPADPEPAELDVTRLTVRLPAFVSKAATGRALSLGMKPSRWVAALVQSNVARHPVFTELELQAVEASTRELAAIGRNINQIARALNEAHFQTERVRLDRLDQLTELIRKTRENIRALVKSSRNAWREDV